MYDAVLPGKYHQKNNKMKFRLAGKVCRRVSRALEMLFLTVFWEMPSSVAISA